MIRVRSRRGTSLRESLRGDGSSTLPNPEYPAAWASFRRPRAEMAGCVACSPAASRSQAERTSFCATGFRESRWSLDRNDAAWYGRKDRVSN
jgi:hypothetical protein